MSRFTTALAASVSLIAFNAHAVTTVPTIVVSASRTPLPISHVASSITVIGQEEIERLNKATVVELLRAAPGVTVAQSGAPGQTARAFLRGANSAHVLVLIDGVRANDPSDVADAFDFSNLSADNIERIEILRGPQSPLYGSDAIGGVIQIFTKQGKGKPRFNMFGEYGRYESRREGAGVNGEAGRTLYSIEASEHGSTGISAFNKERGGHERDGTRGYNFSANATTQVTDALKTKVTARYSRVDSEFDMLGSLTPDSTLPHNDTRQFTGRVAGELALCDGKWEQELGIGTLNVSRFLASGFDYDHHLGNRYSIDWMHRLRFIPRNLTTVGFEAYDEDYHSDNNGAHSVTNKAVLINDQFDITDAFFVNGGARLDDHQIFGKKTTWKIAPGYRIDSTGTLLKASYGTGFKAPSLYQLYSAFFGSTTLQPETSKGYDVGFEQKLWDDKVTFGATYFHNDIRELLDVIQLVPFDPFSFRYVNVGKARTMGAESFVTYRPNADWLISANYTYTLSDDKIQDLSLVRRPKHQASASATYQFNEKLDVNGNMRFVGSREDYDLAFSRTRMPSFTVFGVGGNYQLTPEVTLYSRIDNLLNKHYEEVYGFGTYGMSLFVGAKTQF